MDRIGALLGLRDLPVASCLGAEEGRALRATGDFDIGSAVYGACWPREVGGSSFTVGTQALMPTGIGIKEENLIYIADCFNGVYVTVRTAGGYNSINLNRKGCLQRAGAMTVSSKSPIIYVTSLAMRCVEGFRLTLGAEIKIESNWTYGFASPFSNRSVLETFRQPVSLTVASRLGRELLVVADAGLQHVSAWDAETADFKFIVIDRARGITHPRAVLAVDEHLIVFDSRMQSIGYAHLKHQPSHLRARVLAWSGDGAEVVYTMEMPGEIYDISAAYMPLSKAAHESRYWTKKGKIIITDQGHNLVYVLSWQPGLPDMVAYEDTIGDPCFDEPVGVAVNNDSIIVINRGTNNLCVIDAGAPRPPAPASDLCNPRPNFED